MQSYVRAERQRATDLSLGDIVELDSQYEGTKKGRSDFEAFAGMPPVDQQRNLERWNRAKTAVETLARDATARPNFMTFVANKDGKGHTLSLRAGRTRTGGNDFW